MAFLSFCVSLSVPLAASVNGTFQQRQKLSTSQRWESMTSRRSGDIVLSRVDDVVTGFPLTGPLLS